jgi:hypothetical protein
MRFSVVSDVSNVDGLENDRQQCHDGLENVIDFLQLI